MRPLETRGTCKAQDDTDGSLRAAPVEIVRNAEPIAPVLPDVHVWYMLFSLENIQERFGDLLRTWFGRQKQIKPLYQLYFATIRSPEMYVENRFLNMFQALESYDRWTHKESTEARQAHEKRLNRILNAVSSSDKEWLQVKLQYSHEPRAAERLWRLVKKLNAKWLFLDRKDIERTTRLRNSLTHFDRNKEAELPPTDERPLYIYELAVRLQMLCELALLHETGFSTEEVQERMERTRRLQRRLPR